MKILTKAFGEVSIDESQILEFPTGILAFEQFHKYILLSGNESNNFSWLQSVEESSLAFLVMRIRDLLATYTPQTSKEHLEEIQISSLEDGVEILGIITIPPSEPEKMTINLQGPILVNTALKKAAQVISENEEHQVRIPVLEIIGKGEL